MILNIQTILFLCCTLTIRLNKLYVKSLQQYSNWSWRSSTHFVSSSMKDIRSYGAGFVFKITSTDMSLSSQPEHEFLIRSGITSFKYGDLSAILIAALPRSGWSMRRFRKLIGMISFFMPSTNYFTPSYSRQIWFFYLNLL